MHAFRRDARLQDGLRDVLHDQIAIGGAGRLPPRAAQEGEERVVEVARHREDVADAGRASRVQLV